MHLIHDAKLQLAAAHRDHGHDLKPLVARLIARVEELLGPNETPAPSDAPETPQSDAPPQPTSTVAVGDKAEAEVVSGGKKPKT